MTEENGIAMNGHPSKRELYGDDSRPVSAVTQTGVVLAPGTLGPNSERSNRYKENTFPSTEVLTAASSADTLAEDRRNREPLRFCKWITSYPKTSFAITLSAHLLMMIIVVALAVTGHDVIPFNLDSINLDIRNDIDNRRFMAWDKRFELPDLITRQSWVWEQEAEEEEDDDGGPGGNRRARSVGEAPNNQTSTDAELPPIPRDTMEMYFLLENKNVFTKENLETIAEVEKAFYELKDFNDYCMKDEMGNCQPGMCIIRLFEQVGYANIPAVLYQVYSNKARRAQLQYFLGKDANITKDKAISEITRCNIQFTYSSKMRDKTKEEREKDLERYLMQVVKPLADQYYKNKAGKMDFIYGSGIILAKTILQMVYRDAAMIFLSLAFIFIFMSIQTQSLWITCFALLSIVTGFCTTNLLYRYILGYIYIGPFHALAVFIILGIGADDIFIFFDTWKASAHQSYPSVAHRLSDAYRKASMAMLFTSLTTAIAFIVSAASPFLGITTFGVFSGILVLVNYMSVIIFFPCVVVTSIAAVVAAQESISDTNAGEANTKRRNFIVRFFRGPYFQFISHKILRWIILVLYAGVIIFFIYFASTLKIKEDQIEFVKDNSNLGRYISLVQSAFQTTSEDNKITVDLVWGFKPRDVSECDPKKAGCEGKNVLDTEFDLNKDGNQEALLDFCHTLKNLSDSEIDKLHIFKNVLTEKPEVDCFLADMKVYLEKESVREIPDENNATLMMKKYPDDSALSVPVDRKVAQAIMTYNNKIYTTDLSNVPTFDTFFEIGAFFWLYNGFDFDQKDQAAKQRFKTYNDLLGETAEPYNITSDVGLPYHYGTRLVFAAIRVNTSLVFNMGFPTGLPIRNAWEDFMTTQLSKLPESLKGGFQTCGVWHWLKVQKKLSDTAITGIIVGVCISLPILIIATMNVWTGVLATLTICCTTISVIGVIPLAGWKLGVLESINMVMVVGLSVDYVVHLAEGYSRSHQTDRLGRTRDSLEEVGISVLSGAITSLGSSVFLLVASVMFFAQFGLFVFCTIFLSLAYGLGLFPTLLALIGPQNDFASLRPLFKWCCGKCKKN